MIQEIYIIDDDESSILVFRELFKNDLEEFRSKVSSGRTFSGKKGIVMDNPLIGKIPTRKEVRDELNELLMSM